MMILSIIIPIYNVERYVRKTLKSIFSQLATDCSVEVIVVNDGTKDDSMSIVNEFATKFGNMKIINQENQGLSVARNTGLKAAKGKYVWFVDSDDWIEKRFIERILQLLKDDEENVYMMHMRIVNEEDHSERRSPYLCVEQPTSIEGYKLIWMDAKNEVKITPIQRFIIRRNFILERNLFFVPGIYHEDVEYAPRLLVKTDKVTILPWVGYCYLLRQSGSITTDKTKIAKRNESRLTIIENFHKLEGELGDKKKQKAIHFSKYKVMAYLFNESSFEYFYTSMHIKDFGILKCKNLVITNLFYDYNIKHLGRQLLFLISPKLLKILHKQL